MSCKQAFLIANPDLSPDVLEIEPEEAGWVSHEPDAGLSWKLDTGL